MTDEQQWRIERVYLERLAQLPDAKLRDMLYGKWIADECEECHATANVKRYVDTSRSATQSVYLCNACMATGRGTHAKQLREWLPGDK